MYQSFCSIHSLFLTEMCIFYVSFFFQIVDADVPTPTVSLAPQPAPYVVSSSLHTFWNISLGHFIRHSGNDKSLHRIGLHFYIGCICVAFKCTLKPKSHFFVEQVREDLCRYSATVHTPFAGQWPLCTWRRAVNYSTITWMVLINHCRPHCRLHHMKTASPR